MKTTFAKTVAALLLIAGLGSAPTSFAGNILTNKASFVEDTFTLDTPIAVNPFNSQLQELVDATQTRSASGSTLVGGLTLSTSSNLIGTLPELREVDRDHYFQTAHAVPQTWMGSTDLVVTPKTGSPFGPTDGEVRIAATALVADPEREVLACVPLFLQSPGTPYSAKTDWTIQADVDVSAEGSVAGIGWFDNASLYAPGDQRFGSGLGQLWGRVEIKQGSDINGDFEFAQICLMMGNKMLSRVNPRNEDGSYFNFDGYNTIFLQFNDITQEAEMIVNDQTVLTFTALSELALGRGVPLDFDFSESGTRSTPNFFGAGFQLEGGAALDNFAATPEPSSMLMMCFGMLFFGMQNRRQRRRAQKLGLTSSIAG